MEQESAGGRRISGVRNHGCPGKFVQFYAVIRNFHGNIGGTQLGVAVSNVSAGNLNSNVFNATLPFTFFFDGQGYTSINVSSNGFITFGATAPATTNTTPISNTAGYDGAVAAFGGDLNSYFDTVNGTMTGDIRMETVGTAPNREIVIQWKNFRPSNSTSTTNIYLMDFQIRLAETTNEVSVHYGSAGYQLGSTTISGTRQVGLRGSSNTDYNNRLSNTSTNFDSSAAGTANNSSQAYNTTNATPGMPPSGLVYTWNPPTCVAPSGFTANVTSYDSATLNWNTSSTPVANGYDIYYSTINTAPSALTAPTVPGVAGLSHNLNGVLTPSTTYYAWIRSNCTASDLSSWSALPVVFTTDCLPPAILTTAVTPAPACVGDTADLTATADAGTAINWYTAATGGTPVATGATFTTPALTATTSYWVSASTGQTASGGKAQPDANPSNGAGTTNFGLVFDVLAPFTLESVVIYPVSSSSNSGTVVIDVIDGSSNIIHTATIPVQGAPAGSAQPHVATLNFQMVPGTNYKMRPRSMNGISQLYFDPSANAPNGNYGYPFVVPGLLSINTSTLAAAPGNTARNDLYYYFYDWQISTKCESALQEVVVTVDPNCQMSVVDVEGKDKTVTISPNPFTDVVNVSDIKDVKSVTVMDMAGRIVKIIDNPTRLLHLGDLKSGMYLLKLTCKDGSVKTAKAIRK